MKKLWNDECGAILSAELVLVMTIVGLGMVVGLKAIQASVVQELGDVAASFGSINQSYSFSGITGHHSSTAGSFFNDTTDDCDQDLNNNSGPGVPAECIDIGEPATPEANA